MQPRPPTTTTPSNQHHGDNVPASHAPLQMAPMLAPNNAPPRPLMQPTLPHLGRGGGTSTSNRGNSNFYRKNNNNVRTRTAHSPPLPKILTPQGVPAIPQTNVKIPSQILTTTVRTKPNLISNNHKSQPQPQQPLKQAPDESVVDLTEDDGTEVHDPLPVSKSSTTPSPRSSPPPKSNQDRLEILDVKEDDDEEEVTVLGTRTPTPASMNVSSRTTPTNVPNPLCPPAPLLSPLTTSPSSSSSVRGGGRTIIEVPDSLPSTTMVMTEEEDDSRHSSSSCSTTKQSGHQGRGLSQPSPSSSQKVTRPPFLPQPLPLSTAATALTTTRNEAGAEAEELDTSPSKRKDSLKTEDVDILIANIPMAPRPSKKMNRSELIPVSSTQNKEEDMNNNSDSLTSLDRDHYHDSSYQPKHHEESNYKDQVALDTVKDDDKGHENNDVEDSLCQQINDWQPFVDRVAHFMEVENIPFDYFDVWVPVTEEDEHTATTSSSNSHHDDDILECLAQETDPQASLQQQKQAVDHVDYFPGNLGIDDTLNIIDNAATTFSADEDGDGTPQEMQQILKDASSAASTSKLRLKHVGHATKSNTDLCSIFTLYHMEQFGNYSEKFSFPPGVGLPGRVFESAEPMWDDCLQTAQFIDFPRTNGAKRHGVKKGVGIPLMSSTGSGQQHCIIAMYTTEDIPKNVDLVHKCYHEFQMYAKSSTTNARDGFMNCEATTGIIRAPLALLPSPPHPHPPSSITAPPAFAPAGTLNLATAAAPPTLIGGCAGGTMIENTIITTATEEEATIRKEQMRKYCSTLPDNTEVDMAAFLGMQMSTSDKSSISLTKQIMALRFLLLRAPCRRTVSENDKLEELKIFYKDLRTSKKEGIDNSNQGNNANDDVDNRGNNLTISLVEQWEAICSVPSPSSLPLIPPQQQHHQHMQGTAATVNMLCLSPSSQTPNGENVQFSRSPNSNTVMAFSHVNWNP
eukprot:CAMPEP_0195290884 /NCGR_PEP_ID=MMETSP0707-20130614/6568_1 /TAXON_ID=33640 /ORGANISM="Asterionellopsis glacialis, Strain CCMP134" /LENGTH=964 /DNA_ID=CAMNT_0040351065 /DNA_START=273 /DNA_END=3167 /DNA_ORIENTATION=+